MKALGLYVTAQDHLYLAAGPARLGAGSSEVSNASGMHLDAGIPSPRPTRPSSHPPALGALPLRHPRHHRAGVMGEDQESPARRPSGDDPGGPRSRSKARRGRSSGKARDLVVLDEDITCAPERIRDMGIASPWWRKHHLPARAVSV
jgi:hypothetical protein